MQWKYMEDQMQKLNPDVNRSGANCLWLGGVIATYLFLLNTPHFKSIHGIF